MAVEKPVMDYSLAAGEDMRTKQFHIVYIHAASNTVKVCSATTDCPIGVLQNDPNTGETADVMMLGITKVVADEDLGIGNLYGPSADGQARQNVPGTDVTHYIIGKILEEGAAAGDILTASVNAMNPHRAA